MPLMSSPPPEPPEPEPTPLAAYLRFYPWCTEYVRLLLRNSAARNGNDVKGWPT